MVISSAEDGSRLSAVATVFLSAPSILGSSTALMPPQPASILVFKHIALLKLIRSITIS